MCNVYFLQWPLTDAAGERKDLECGWMWGSDLARLWLPVVCPPVVRARDPNKFQWPWHPPSGTIRLHRCRVSLFWLSSRQLPRALLFYGLFIVLWLYTFNFYSNDWLLIPSGLRNIKPWRSAASRQDKVLKITVYILIHEMNNRMMAASYHYPHCIMTSLHRRTLCRVDRLWTVFRRWIRLVQCGW